MMTARNSLICLALALLIASSACAEDELCLTGNARRNRNLAVPVTFSPEIAAALADGSHRDALSVGWPGGPITLTFAEPVRVTHIDLVVYNDPQRSYNAAGRMKAALTRGETPVTETDWASLDQDAVLLCGTDDAIVWGSQSSLQVPSAGPADSLTLTVEKKPGAHQCLLRELYVWGIPESLHEASLAPGQALSCGVRENTYSSVRADWQQLPPGARYARIRFRERGAGTWQTQCFTASPGIVTWLKPDREYELQAEAVGGEPAAAHSQSLSVRLPHPLEVRRMSDLWGMNFYPGGGGAHQPHLDETGNTQRMLVLLQDAGVRHVRWFSAAPSGADLFVDRGLSSLPFATFTEPASYEKLTRETGVWVSATQNEPDFQDTFPEEFVGKFVPAKAAADAFDPLMLLAGPAIGGELFGPGSDYLRDCYRAGLKDAIHALDLHPYPKVSTPTPVGGRLGCPETLIESVAQCRAVMAEFGDSDRPLIVSETGHPTHEGFWWMPPSSYPQQARYVVRNHLILAALGIRRIFWYAFQDEGTDPTNAEHNFGIVDWYGNPKPAYYAYRNMTRLLSDATCEGFLPDLKAPAYGVQCRFGDRFVTAVWDSAGKSELEPAEGCEIQRVVGLMGEERPLPILREGRRVLPIDENPRYLFSSAPLHFAAQRRLDPPIAPRMLMRLEPSMVHVKRGETVSWQVHLDSEYECETVVILGTPHPWHGAAPRHEITLPARGKTTVQLSLTVPQDAKPGIVSWDTKCSVTPGDARFASEEVRRALYFIVPRE
ncbi:MAG: hypothetical protein HPY44_05600 [Armatimonadetes bacterium]|nr:hypothetical protein [Armatimonadota bacterium]